LKRHNPFWGLSTKGDEFPVGGHIHLGFSNWDECETKEENFNKFNIMYSIIATIDDFLGDYYIKWSGEARWKYKIRRSCEMKSWGFEYRTPPAAIFSTPEFLKINLKLIWGIAKDVLRGYNFAKLKWEKVMRRYISEKELETFVEFKVPNGDILRFWGFPPIDFEKTYVQMPLSLDYSDGFKKFTFQYLRELAREEDIIILIKGIGVDDRISGFPFIWKWKGEKIMPTEHTFYQNKLMEGKLYYLWLPHFIRVSEFRDLKKYLLPQIEKDIKQKKSEIRERANLSQFISFLFSDLTTSTPLTDNDLRWIVNLYNIFNSTSANPR